MDDLFRIIKWYLLATAISALYGTAQSVNYISETLTHSQELYLDLIVNILITCAYFVALLKTLSTLRAISNNLLKPTIDSSAD